MEHLQLTMCGYCGKEFVPTTFWHRYCSDSHKVMAYRLRKQGKTLRKGTGGNLRKSSVNLRKRQNGLRKQQVSIKGDGNCWVCDGAFKRSENGSIWMTENSDLLCDICASAKRYKEKGAKNAYRVPVFW